MDHCHFEYREISAKNCILTGANRGIGYGLLVRLVENGVNVWACARKRSTEFEEIIAALGEKHGVWVKPIYFDLADPQQIKDGFKQIIADKQPIDYFINNAGIAHHKLFAMTSIDEIRQVYETNVFGPMILLQGVIRKMQRQKSGSIVNICSIAGLDSHPGDSIYGSSKAALISVTRTTAAECAASNIRINGVAPGPIDTEIFARDPSMAAMKEDSYKYSAMHRLGIVDEVADAVLYLLSERSSFVNGQIIRIDGGQI